jgi:MerR family Zn(II)-responsive transcriptional regulator of zntA
MKDTAPSTSTRATLAKLAGVGAESLRFYEQQGLIEKPARNEAGYRIDDGDDLDRLQFIRRAQDLGFSLQNIKPEGETCHE